MLVIGVAEPENPYSSQEIESQRRHLTYEEDMAYGIAEAAKYFFAAFKSFGVSGLRQRILVCHPFSCQSRLSTDLARFTSGFHTFRSGAFTNKLERTFRSPETSLLVRRPCASATASDGGLCLSCCLPQATAWCAIDCA